MAEAPSYDCGHAYHALYLAWSHRRTEALAEITRSRELNPGASFATTESAVYFQLRDYPNLIEASRKGVASDPTEWLEHYFLGVGYEASGRRAEAIPEYQKAIDMSAVIGIPLLHWRTPMRCSAEDPRPRRSFLTYSTSPKIATFPPTCSRPYTPGWARPMPHFSY